MSKKQAPINEALDQFVEALIKETFQDIVSERFKRYSKYIIQERALPDARDGLKPVQRRILYAMYQMRLFPDASYKKSARIAGDVMGKYHPHGETSIYDAMVRMSQDFKMYLPLVDMHGNNGSIDGDSAAAMRYTEARLSVSAQLLLKDIEARTVPFIPNYDDEEVEPTVLPAKFPNLLVNGATGISAGYATKIPPHNVHEVIEATIALIKNENLTTLDLMAYIKGPDFPTGGLVQGKEGIFQALDTGAGKVVIRSQYHFEDIKHDQKRVVIDQIPYDINKSELVKSIDQLRIQKKFEDIAEIRDESDKDGLRIAIDLKKGKDPEFAINYLFKVTDLQLNYHYNMVAILQHRPLQVGIIPILKAYIYHQKEVVTNRSHYQLKKAETRLHIVEGLIKMVSILDQIIENIRASKNKQTAKENIMRLFDFSDTQAEAIVTLQLYRLSNTDVMLLEQEESSLKETISGLHLILKSDEALSKVIIDELKATDKAIGIPRRSVIEADIENIKIAEKDLITDEQVMIGLTRDGYIKRSSLKSYQMSQQVSLKSEDVMMYERPHQTLETLIMFTNLGNFIYLPVYKLEDQKWKDLGVYIHNIVPLEPNEIIIEVMTFNDFKLKQTLILLTALGQIKQVKLEDFEMVRYQKTTKAMVLDPEDALVRVVIAEGDYVSIMTEGGYMLNIHRGDIPYYGLNARGVKSISLVEDDIATALTTFNLDDDIHVLSSRGHLITIEKKPISKRGRKGFLAIEPLKSQPHIPLVMKATSSISEDMHIYIYTSQQIHMKTFHELISKHNKYGKFVLDSKTEYIQYVHFDFYKEDSYKEIVLDESLKKPKVHKIIEDNIENVEEDKVVVSKESQNDVTDHIENTLKDKKDSTDVSSEIVITQDQEIQSQKVIEETNIEKEPLKETKPKQKSDVLPKKQTIILNRLDLFDDEE